MKNHSITKAKYVYRFLLCFYPPAYQKQFRTEMLQTFSDHYRDVENNASGSLTFWLDVVGDELSNIVKEQFMAWGGSNKVNKYTLGITLGFLSSLLVILTNVIFPTPNTSDDGPLIPIAYLGMFFLFGVGGYLSSQKPKPWQSGAIGGGVTALLSVGLIMLTFVVIDNLFLDIVSQQVDKVSAFHNQHTFNNMRDFINHALMQALLIGLPLATIFGALFGTIGGAIRRFVTH